MTRLAATGGLRAVRLVDTRARGIADTCARLNRRSSGANRRELWPTDRATFSVDEEERRRFRTGRHPKGSSSAVAAVPRPLAHSCTRLRLSKTPYAVASIEVTCVLR